MLSPSSSIARTEAADPRSARLHAAAIPSATSAAARSTPAAPGRTATAQVAAAACKATIAAASRGEGDSSRWRGKELKGRDSAARQDLGGSGSKADRRSKARE